ncbi:PRO41 protein [Apiospora arundinis]|uniref:PRO41 protein n=1 Tax=Apiospora arundinis TaxID=335852 RepID=A0ABR2I9P4_9PEZI
MHGPCALGDVACDSVAPSSTAAADRSGTPRGTDGGSPRPSNSTRPPSNSAGRTAPVGHSPSGEPALALLDSLLVWCHFRRRNQIPTTPDKRRSMAPAPMHTAAAGGRPVVGNDSASAGGEGLGGAVAVFVAVIVAVVSVVAVIVLAVAVTVLDVVNGVVGPIEFVIDDGSVSSIPPRAASGHPGMVHGSVEQQPRNALAAHVYQSVPMGQWRPAGFIAATGDLVQTGIADSDEKGLRTHKDYVLGHFVGFAFRPSGFGEQAIGAIKELIIAASFEPSSSSQRWDNSSKPSWHDSSYCRPPLVHHVLAAVQAFIWPKVFWDFLTTRLDASVAPVPILQVVNLLCALALLALEWPAPALAGTAIHASLALRIVVLPLAALLAVLLYQATNAALFYLIGMGLYAWGYSSWETICVPGDGPRRHIIIIIIIIIPRPVMPQVARDIPLRRVQAPWANVEHLRESVRSLLMAVDAAGPNQDALRRGVAGPPGSPIDLEISSPSGSTSTMSWESGDAGACSPTSQALRPASPAATEQAASLSPSLLPSLSPSLSPSPSQNGQGGTSKSPRPWSPNRDDSLKAGRHIVRQNLGPRFLQHDTGGLDATAAPADAPAAFHRRSPLGLQYQPRTPTETRPSHVQLPGIREMLRERRHRRQPQSRGGQGDAKLPGIHNMLKKRTYSKRTRTGCLTCRARHKKCDEATPFCTSTSVLLYSLLANSRTGGACVRLAKVCQYPTP